LIQLAAGMAIDVDATLDLRGHSGTDALERLKERLLDGHLLGWRTLHVHLGPSEALRTIFLEFLASPEAALVARYAQAPIPMGGAQAWILYLGLQGQVPH
ncbi:MAG TPA: Smr/MutS family protein, partial [Holophaga sp.]|nr:Smr/MutS family protein [Holophaga sp.]